MWLAINLINFYQKFISADRGVLFYLGLGPACKQTPTCSEYTKQQIIKEGIIKGSLMGAKRILSCR